MAMAMAMASVAVVVVPSVLQLPCRSRNVPAFPDRVLELSAPLASLDYWQRRRKNRGLPAALLGAGSGHGEAKRVPGAGAGCRAVACAALATEDASNRTDVVVASLKAQLLRVVAGIDRGLVASEADTKAAESAARLLEDAGSVVKLPEDLDNLQGRWRLIYSSAFSSGSFGGRRPGPPIGRLPLVLGQVYQRIDVVSKELDNIVDLRIGTLLPLPPIEVTATLAHTFELTGGARIRIMFEKTIVKLGGALSQFPSFVLPQLPEIMRSSSSSGIGQFQTTFIDTDLRISRGDGGELRIFLRS